jgi:hypothetical protein
MKGYLDKLNNSGKNGSEGFGVSKEGSKVAKYKKKYTKIKRLVKQIIFVSICHSMLLGKHPPSTLFYFIPFPLF